jgi:hypothetical protein
MVYRLDDSWNLVDKCDRTSYVIQNWDLSYLLHARRVSLWRNIVKGIATNLPREWNIFQKLQNSMWNVFEGAKMNPLVVSEFSITHVTMILGDK